MTTDLAALSAAYAKSPNALSLTLLGHALVDEWQAGNLVQIDREGMRERVIRAIANANGSPHLEDWEIDADAAIAAILGGE